MARYLTVEEAAEALGTTDRTVRRMLNDGRLNGSQHLDKGKMVWRVHATKEILQKLEATYQAAGLSLDSLEIEDAETTDDVEPHNNNPTEGPRSWLGAERESLRILAEEMVKPLVETIRDQTSAMALMRHDLEEKERQLRLLPDLQKQAERERKDAELRALEIEALKKQISAIEQERMSFESKLAELEEKQLSRAEEQRLAEEELDRMRVEKEVTSQVVQEQLTSLLKQLEKFKKPWWKKWFLPQDAE